jgi:hypothetical protein
VDNNYLDLDMSKSGFIYPHGPMWQRNATREKLRGSFMPPPPRERVPIPDRKTGPRKKRTKRFPRESSRARQGEEERERGGGAPRRGELGVEQARRRF